MQQLSANAQQATQTCAPAWGEVLYVGDIPSFLKQHDAGAPLKPLQSHGAGAGSFTLVGSLSSLWRVTMEMVCSGMLTDADGC
jgi:hypothetical protein